MAGLVSQPVYTYVLRDPESSIPIYVGKGVWDRAYKHRFQPSPIGAHVRGLVARGLTPTYQRFPVKDADEAFELEEFLVDQIGRIEDGSGPLLNVRRGGRNFSQPASTRAKLSAAHMGKTISAEHRASISRTLSGTVQSEERKARQSIRMKEWWAERKHRLQDRS